MNRDTLFLGEGLYVLQSYSLGMGKFLSGHITVTVLVCGGLFGQFFFVQYMPAFGVIAMN